MMRSHLLRVVLLVVAVSSIRGQEFPPVGNEWIAAKDDDVRSPCPFINTLANHGFIERSGKDVDLFGMVQSLAENFDVARTLFDKLALGAISFNLTTTDANGTVRMDIDELFAHNKQEHDASFVRADHYFGEEESMLPDPALLQVLFEETAPNSTVLTKEDLLAYQTMRIKDSLANNPKVRIVASQATSFSAQPTLLLVFGQDPELKSVNKAKLREFLEFERFPEGYIPLTLTDNEFEPHDVLADGTLAQTIRLEFAENFESLLPETSMPTNTPMMDVPTSSAQTITVFLSSFAVLLFVVLQQ